LYLKDEQFDACYSAFLKCEGFLRRAYEDSVKFYTRKLLDILVNDYLRAQTSVAATSKTIPVSFVVTSLSDYDRTFALNHIVSQLESRLSILVADSDCSGVSAAHEVLAQLASSYREKLIIKTNTERYRGAKSNEIAKSIGEQTALMLESPLSALKISTMQEETNTVLVVLRNVEKLQTKIFSDFMEALYRCNELNFVVIGFASEHCPLSLHLKPSTTHANLSCSFRSTCTPFELYDEFMGKVFATSPLPMAFPVPVVNWLHEKFWRSNNCVQSTMER
jgi:hypothetical protein